jgi:hypothetical protein
MIGRIASDYSSHNYGSQPSPVARNPAQPVTSQSSLAELSPPTEDSIQLSASGVAALQPPGEVFIAAAEGDAHAISMIEESQSQIPHNTDGPLF